VFVCLCVRDTHYRSCVRKSLIVQAYSLVLKKKKVVTSRSTFLVALMLGGKPQRQKQAHYRSVLYIQLTHVSCVCVTRTTCDVSRVHDQFALQRYTNTSQRARWGSQQVARRCVPCDTRKLFLKLGHTDEEVN
jgi:hypothetical protein